MSSRYNATIVSRVLRLAGGIPNKRDAALARGA
jgi:hypothetical protein